MSCKYGEGIIVYWGVDITERGRTNIHLCEG